MIGLWSGSIGSIPARWQLCDGTHGAPDLRDKFIRCASSTLPPGTTGGTANHSHTRLGTWHYHQAGAFGNVDAGTGYDKYTLDAFLTGPTDLADHSPEFYTLCYLIYTG